ncbi:MAG TPA: cell division protein ZapE [Gammaproteobacteria bacterium]|nr:cell division protein ZapE [Gammaproteobacteria bacterium]
MDSPRKHLTPLERYRQDLSRPGFAHDPAQARVVEALDRLHHELVATAPDNLWQRLLAHFRKDSKPVRGLYIWGEVGRGKTYLMDCFYQSLPFPEKKRLHFHRFMRAVHDELHNLRHREDPLAIVASRWADAARVICFDEFAVTDITDATLLGRLLRHLFDRGIRLVATSNIEPDQLYKNGLKRELFLPAIALLKRHTRVIHCDNGDDYRLRQLSQAKLYYSPSDLTVDHALRERFQVIAGTDGEADQLLTIEGREISARRTGDGVVWFDFGRICGGPRSANDYIEIARLFHTVIVSDIPRLGQDREDEARRFIALVDEFYDRGVKLIISAAAPIDELYEGQRLRMEFTRTRSRLTEMQSKEYLARPHTP